MRILVATHHLDDYAGSELYTRCLVGGLIDRGHDVRVFTRYPGSVAAEVAARGVPVTSTVGDLISVDFDVAHVHHNLTAIDVRHHLPRLPMLFLSHGVVPFLETPPGIDAGIGRFAAVSEGGAQHLRALGVDSPVEVHRNLVDVQEFTPVHAATDPPRRALVLSSQMTLEKLAIVERACAMAGVDMRVVGAPGPRVPQGQVATAITEADVVIGQGRGIVEAMLSERPAIVFNPPMSDGLITPEAFVTSMTENFSGRALRRDLTAAELAAEIRGCDPADLAELRRLAIQHFGVDAGVERLLATYERLAATAVPEYDATAVAWAYSALGMAGEYAAEAYRRHAEYQLLSMRDESNRMLLAAQASALELQQQNEACANELRGARAEIADLASRVAEADRRWLPGRAHQLRAWLRERRGR